MLPTTKRILCSWRKGQGGKRRRGSVEWGEGEGGEAATGACVTCVKMHFTFTWLFWPLLLTVNSVGLSWRWRGWWGWWCRWRCSYSCTIVGGTSKSGNIGQLYNQNPSPELESLLQLIPRIAFFLRFAMNFIYVRVCPFGGLSARTTTTTTTTSWNCNRKLLNYVCRWSNPAA